MNTTSHSRLSDDAIALLAVVPLGMLLPTVLYFSGYDLLFLVSLGFLPFVLACWGLSKVVGSARTRAIYANLTDGERKELMTLAREYGSKLGLRFSAIMFPLYFVGFILGAYYLGGPVGF